MNGLDWLLRDLSYAFRMLARHKARTLAAIVTLALAMGATGTIVALVQAIAFHAFPGVDEPRKVAWIFETVGKLDDAADTVPPATYLDWKKRSQRFSVISAFRPAARTLTDDGDPERLTGLLVSADMARTMGLRLPLGRAIAPEEEAESAGKVVLLGHKLWEKRFGRDPGVVGRTIVLDGAKHTVIGVLPERLELPIEADFWAPLVLGPEDRQNRIDGTIVALGRVADGATLEQANAELETIARAIAEEHPDTNAKKSANGVDVATLLMGPARPLAVVQAVAAALVLLVACVNIANLLLATTASRRREMAVRVALGASRGVLVRQLLLEALVLGALGGALGVLIAAWCVDALLASVPAELVGRLRGIADMRVGGVTLAVCGAVTLVISLGFGALPALRASQTSLEDALKDGSGGATGARGAQRLSLGLVAAELALAVSLVTAAAVAVSSYRDVLRTPLGFAQSPALVVTMTRPPGEGVSDAFTRLAATARAMPGVRAVTLTTSAPLARGYDAVKLQLPGQEALADADVPWSKRVLTDDAYFATMGIPVLEGRGIEARDGKDDARVLVLSQRAARRLFGDERALGRTILVDRRTPATVVGVVADVLDRHGHTMGNAYLPLAQHPHRGVTAVVRTAGDPRVFERPLRDAMRIIDPGQPLDAVRTLEHIVDTYLWARRAVMVLLGSLATLALVLSAVGVYGVVSHGVAARSAELGVRAALGATPARLLATVAWSTARAAIPGVLAGVALSVPLVLALARASVGDGRFPIPVALGVAALLTLVAALASLGPARAAARTSPLLAMRRVS